MRNLKKLTAILLVSAMCIGTAFTSFASEVSEGAAEDVADEGSPNTKPGNGGTTQTPGTQTPGTQTPSDDTQTEVDSPVIVLGDALDKNGNRVPTVVEQITDKKVIETLTSEESLKKILGSKYQVGSKDQVTVLAASEITLEGEMPEGGVTITMAIVDGDVKPGNTVYVLHQKKDGSWEVFEAVVDATGNISVHFDSLSPVAIVKVMSDGSVKVLDTKTTTATSEKKSPKTGE